MEFLRLNSAPWEWRDAYHWLLTLSWPSFALFLLCFFLGMNAGFAACYHFGPGGDIAEMRPGSYADAFFFSVETLATVGYGHMYPVTTYGHVVATAEILVGMFALALMTGLIFVRFSRPHGARRFLAHAGPLQLRRRARPATPHRQPAQPADGRGRVPPHAHPHRVGG